MRKHIVPSILALLLISHTATANPVDVSMAQNIGAKFLNANTKVVLRGSSNLELIKTYNTESGNAAFYVFNAPNGYVIVAADDCAHPILGYSDESQFNNEDVPINMQEYLEGFVEQIAYGVENQLVDPNIARQWQLVQATGRVTETRDATVVEPMLTDIWEQGEPYNLFCPVDEDTGYSTVVGCVALSMAQIMHYWGYPAYGTGSMSYKLAYYPEQYANFGATAYDWAHMPDELPWPMYTGAPLTAQDSVNILAVNTLLWHCGVSVQISYGVGATTGNSEAVAVALVNNFCYSPELYGVYKYNFTNDEWLSKVKTCLDLGRPIHYSGGAHAFVCDGYNASDYCHFNWGWGGNYNGYYQLEAMNTGNGSYHNGNYAIFDIHPNCTSGSDYQITTTANLTKGGTVAGEGTYACGSGCTLTATPANGYRFCSWTEGGSLVSTESTYNFNVMSDKNIVANFIEDTDDYCTIVFDLYDSYSDGWNGNYLTVNYSNGCFSSEQLTIDDGCSTTFSRNVLDVGITFAPFDDWSADDVEVDNRAALSVTVTAGDHGSASVDKATAKKGEIVTLTCTPASDYEVDEITVTSGGVTIGSDGKFVMGDKAVAISVSFKAEG